MLKELKFSDQHLSLTLMIDDNHSEQEEYILGFGIGGETVQCPGNKLRLDGAFIPIIYLNMNSSDP